MSEELSPEQEDRRKAGIMVKARYLGHTTVVFPHLVRAEWDPKQGPDPVAVINHGDEFMVDLYSAEAREDLEVVNDEAKPKGKASTSPKED